MELKIQIQSGTSKWEPAQTNHDDTLPSESEPSEEEGSHGAPTGDGFDVKVPSLPKNHGNDLF